MASIGSSDTGSISSAAPASETRSTITVDGHEFHSWEPVICTPPKGGFSVEDVQTTTSLAPVVCISPGPGIPGYSEPNTIHNAVKLQASLPGSNSTAIGLLGALSILLIATTLGMTYYRRKYLQEIEGKTKTKPKSH